MMGNAMSEREWKLLFEVQRLNRQVEEVVRVQHEIQTIMRADGQAALRMIERIKKLEAKVARLSPPEMESRSEMSQKLSQRNGEF